MVETWSKRIGEEPLGAHQQTVGHGDCHHSTSSGNASKCSANFIHLDLEYKLLRERNLHAVHLCCHYIQDYEELAINHHLSLDSTNTTY